MWFELFAISGFLFGSTYSCLLESSTRLLSATDPVLATTRQLTILLFCCKFQWWRHSHGHMVRRSQIFRWGRRPEFWWIARLARRPLHSSVDPPMLVLQLQWVPRATTAELVPPSVVSLLHMYKALYVWLIYRREFDPEPCMVDCMSCWREFLIAADSAPAGSLLPKLDWILPVYTILESICVLNHLSLTFGARKIVILFCLRLVSS